MAAFAALFVAVFIALPGLQASDHRLYPGNLQYLGAFTTPEGVFGPTPYDRFNYSAGHMAFNPEGNEGAGSLYLDGHPYAGNRVAEISIPAPVIVPDYDPARLPRATVLHPFTDISGGFIAERNILGGLAFLDAGDGQGMQLFWDRWIWYNVSGQDIATHGQSHPFPASPLNVRGVWHLGTYHNQRTGGSIFAVPKLFADQFLGGRRLVSGIATVRTGGSMSYGPPMYAYAPWQHAVQPPPDGATLDAVRLLEYPHEHPLSDFSVGDSWDGAAWAASGDRQAVLVAGFKSLGDFFYGAPRPGDCENGKGGHSDPFEPQILFYDPADLAAVAQGNKQPWEPDPYVRFSPKDSLWPTCRGALAGAAFNEKEGLLYLVQTDVSFGMEPGPIVHVYRVTSTAVPPLIVIQPPAQVLGPQYAAQPVNQVAAPAHTATFRVTAVGEGPLSYQWRKNGSLIAGANAPVYTTPPASAADNGAVFDCVVSNPAGSITSQAATLRVDAGLALAYWPFEETAGPIVKDEAGSGFDGVFVGEPARMTGQVGRGLGFAELGERVRFPNVALPPSYTISLWIFPESPFPVPVPLTQSETDPIETLVAQRRYARLWSVPSYNTGLFYTGADRKIDFQFSAVIHHKNETPLPENQWSHVALTRSPDGRATLWLNGQPDGAFEGAPAFNIDYLGSNDFVEAFKGRIDEVRVYGRVLDAAEISDLASPTLSAPVFFQQPMDQTAAAGTQRSFTALAAGTPAPHYQWQMSADQGTTWSPVTAGSGGTSSTYTTAILTTADDGLEFCAVATNSEGEATSQKARLTVHPTPPVSEDPGGPSSEDRTVIVPKDNVEAFFHGKDITVEIFSRRGQLMKTLRGPDSISFGGDGLSPGMYFYRVKGPNGNRKGKLIVVR